jgi:hypothetical protein
MENARILDKISRIQIPRKFEPEQLAVAARDAEILADRLRSEPVTAHALVEALLIGEQERAHNLLMELRLTEEQVRSEGGGLFWLIVLAVCLYSTDAY